MFHKVYITLNTYGLMIWLWVILGIVVLLVIIVISYYNRFSVLSNRIDSSLSQIDVQLKKRVDLVPNLIATVKGYAKHESGIMKEVTEARKQLVAATTLEKRAKAGAQLQTALGSLFAIAENYPQLKANENFLQLQNELAAIEERIAYSRQFYNDSILAYNNLATTFPGTLFNHTKREFLEIAAEERKVPKVSF
jgi:LemA protein